MSSAVATASGWSRGQRLQLSGIVTVIVVLHVVGWSLYLALSSGPLGAGAFAGAGVLAYVLGIRHAFDADHIAAIDDTTRLMVQRGRRPVGVGFFFAMGHSSVVVVLSLVIAVAAGAEDAELGLVLAALERPPGAGPDRGAVVRMHQAEEAFQRHRRGLARRGADLDVAVESSSGTYVRALARDLGATLGVGGHLTALRRTRVGPFRLEHARTLPELEEAPGLSLPLAAAVTAAFARRDVDAPPPVRPWRRRVRAADGERAVHRRRAGARHHLFAVVKAVDPVPGGRLRLLLPAQQQ